MLTYDERVRQVAAKLDRARHHALELKLAVSRFLGAEPVGVECDVSDPDRGPSYRVRRVVDVPDDVALGLGDLCHNLTGALDHLAFQLVCRDTNDQPPRPTRVYFPIFESQEQHLAHRASKLEGASPETLLAIDAVALEPHIANVLRQLQRLNNTDKHRLLLPVVARQDHIDLAPIARQALEGLPSPFPGFHELLQDMPAMLFEIADPVVSVKLGDELLSGPRGGQCNPHQTFHFRIGLSECGIPCIVTFALQATGTVEQVVHRLLPVLREQ